MLIVAYYTKDTPYKAEAEQLAANLDDLGIPHRIQEVPNLGSWQANTQYKSRFIADILATSLDQSSFVYLDVDAAILSCPTLLYKLPSMDVDIAAARFGGVELLSGTVYFGCTQKTDEVVDGWIRLCEKYPKSFPAGVVKYHPRGGAAWDQRMLSVAIDRTAGVRFHELPPEYCYIHDLSAKRYPDVKPIILHTAASRRYKKIIK
jgi:hypothetical protein